MSVIEEAKNWVFWNEGVANSNGVRAVEVVNSLIKELEQQKTITEAAKFLVKVKRCKDTQVAQYQASWPIALRKIEETVDNLGEDNE